MHNLWLKIKKKIGKILFFGIFAIFLLLGAIHIYSSPSQLEVDFLDVGQGDSALIKTPSGQVVLIDGGPDNKVLRQLGANLPFYRRRIDYMILSHYHDDHVTGLVEVLKRYQVGKIIYKSGNPPTAILQILLAAARIRSRPILVVEREARLTLGAGCFLALLNPDILGIKADENNSLAARLECASQTFLFTGDDSLKVEKALLNSGWDVRAQVLKAAHHGSNSANSEAFLRAVHPQLMVISVGVDNSYGHPAPLVLERAAQLGLTVKRTDREGNIRVVSP
jgi:competence protein ComEC